jgi:hypothetical protein
MDLCKSAHISPHKKPDRDENNSFLYNNVIFEPKIIGNAGREITICADNPETQTRS